MRLTLIGKHGQLGHDLVTSLAPLGQVSALGREEVDLENPEQLRQVLSDTHPDVIVNAAAYTAVDKAESEPDRANAINGKAPAVMADIAQSLGAGLIHLSTDYVFDGRNCVPYLEDDPTHPLGAYGASKVLGEEAVRQRCDRHLILRTAWVYGVGGKGNFVKTMLRLGKEREELRVVVDQVGTPTWTGHLAEAIAQFVPRLCPAATDTPGITGTYHVTNSGAISWYDFAIAIFEEAESLGFPLQIKRVVPITTPEYPTVAQRPQYSVLSHKKTAETLGKTAPHWRQSLRHMLAAYQATLA